MSITVWTSEIKWAYLGGNSLSEIYVWDKLVRPSGWKPWANTLLYLPLESDTKDYSWNWRNVTNSGTITYNTIWWWKWATGGSNGYLTVTPTNFITSSLTGGTISFRFYKSTNTTWTRAMEFAIQNNVHFLFDVQSWPVMRYYVDDASNRTASILSNAFSLNVWSNIVVTLNGATIKMYKNWTLENTITSTTSSPRWIWPSTLQQGQKIFANRNGSSTWGSWNYLSNIIIENVVWGDGDVTNYYNQTKWNYGL